MKWLLDLNNSQESKNNSPLPFPNSNVSLGVRNFEKCLNKIAHFYIYRNT